MAQGVDLDDHPDRDLLILEQPDQPVEDRLPVLVAGEIVVGDEVADDPLGVVVPDNRLDVVGRPPSRLAALDIDDSAERALERTAAPSIEAGVGAEGAVDHLGRQVRRRGAFQGGQVVHEVVDRLQPPGDRVADDLDQAPFLGLAGEDEAPQIQGLLNVGLDPRQHRQGAGDVEAADADSYAPGAEVTGDFQCAGKLVGLHAHQHHHPRPGGLNFPRDAPHAHPGVALIDGHELESEIAQRPSLARRLRDPVQTGQRIGWDW